MSVEEFGTEAEDKKFPIGQMLGDSSGAAAPGEREKKMSSLKQAVALALLLTMAVVSCTNSGSSSDPAPSPVNSFPTQSLGEAQTLAAQANVICTDPAGCSPSVGMLIGTTATSAYQCTAFLIAGNVVATNSHCIPDDLKAGGSSCQGRISVLFPNVGAVSSEKFDCADVIVASAIANVHDRPDYAFIHLSGSSQRPALHISHAGLDDGETLHIDKIDPYQGNGIPEGYLHGADCKVVYGSVIADRYSSEQAPVMAVGDCLVVHGNSGSPMLNSKGEVPAIVFAGIDDGGKNTLLDSLNSQGLTDFDGAIAALGVVTNYACVSAPGDLPTALNPNCKLPNQPKEIDTSPADKTMLNTRANEAISKLPKTFAWQANSLGGKKLSPDDQLSADRASSVILLEPKCIQDEQALLKQAGKSLIFGYGSELRESVQMPFWTMTVGFDKYLVAAYRLNEADPAFESNITLVYDPKQLASTHRTRVSLRNAADSIFASPLYSEEIGLCPPPPAK